MSFKQNLHLEQNIEERVEMYWDFKPSCGLVDGQKFAVMSIVCPEGTTQKSTNFGVKIFGCFSSLQDANDYAKKLQGECNAFDYYTVETQCWAKLPPKVEKLDDQNYQEEELEALKNTIIKTRQAKAKMMEERILHEKAENKKKNAALEASSKEITEKAETTET
jgi:hypothetical protein